MRLWAWAGFILALTSHLVEANSLKVKTVKVEAIDQFDTLDANAVVSRTNVRLIAAKSRGSIEVLNIQPGDRFAPGEYLLEIYDNQLSFGLAKKALSIKVEKLKMQQAENQFSMYQKLFSKNTISQEILDQYELDFNLAKNSLQLTQSDYQRLLQDKRLSTITAPKHITVIERMVREGEWVDKGRPLLRVLDLEAPIQINLLVTLDTLDKLKLAEKITLHLPDLEPYPLSAEHVKLIPVVRDGSQIVDMRVALPINRMQQMKLLPGQQLRVTLEMMLPDNLLAIDSDAVSQSSGGHTVWKWLGENQLPQPISIKLITFGQNKAIVNAYDQLNINDEIIVSGNDYLLLGSKVTRAGLKENQK